MSVEERDRREREVHRLEKESKRGKYKCDPTRDRSLILPATVLERIVCFMPKVSSDLHCMSSHPNHGEQASANVLKGSGWKATCQPFSR